MSKIININDVYSSSAVMGSWADWAKIVDIIYEKYNVDINTCSGASVGGWSSSGASVGGWVCPTKTIWDRISNEIEESTISIKGNYLDNQLVKESDFTWGYKPADITINPTSLSFAAPASSKDINVTLNHVPSGDYNVVSTTDWLTLNKQSDKTVVTTAKNLNSSNRSTSIEFLCEGRANTDSQTATVTQSGVSLNLSSTSWSPTYTAQTKTGIKVTSSYEWSIASKPDWVTVTKTSGNSGETLNVSVIKNTSNSDRDGNVQFKCGNVTKNLYIKQSGSPKIAIDSTTLSITPASQNKTITVTLTNLSKYTVSSNQSWVTVPTGDQTSNSVVLNISANSSGARSATVTFTGYDLNGNVCTTSNNSAAVKTLTINQSTGVSSITVTPETWNLSKVDAASTTGKITITNSSSWSVKSKPSWITVTPSSGTATSNITISTAKNTGSNRSGSIVFECVGTYDSNTPSDNIAVTQKGKSAIDITPNAGLSFGPSASSSTASVSRTNIDTYSVEDNDGGNPNWCTATASGDTVAVTVTKNTGASRTCNVTVKGTGTSDGSQRSDSIPISQSAGNSSFSMSPVSFTTGPDATNVGTATYSSTRTSTPQIEKVTSQTWCTATAVTNGWSFSVEKNTSAARTAKFKVTCKGTYDDKEYAQEITVSQSSGVSGIVVTPATWNPTYKEQNISTNVTLTNATGYTPSVTYTNGSGWCTVNGNKISVLNYQSTSTSNRAATVTYTATGTHDSQSRIDTVVVTQTPGAYLTSGKTSWDAPALNASTTFNVDVYNADGFTVRSGYADWVTVTNNGDSVTIVCSENVANAARSTTVYFDTKNGKDGSSYYQSCVITQRAATISSRPYSVDITTSNFTMKYNSNATKQLAWTTKDIKTINGKDSGDPYVVSSTPTFSSNKTGNATVDSSGVVKFKAGSNDGKETSINVTITATYGNSDTVTATVQDVVTKGAVASRRLAVSPSSAQTIYVNDTVTLSATGYTTYWKNINNSQSSYKYDEENDGAQTCSWSTSNSNTASISSSSASSITVTGKKGKGDGTETTVAATITAKNTTYNSNGVTVTFNVKDKITSKFISITSPSSAATIYVGGTQTYTAKKYHRINNGTTNYDMGNGSISWSSSSTSVATMSGATATGKAGKRDGTESTVSTTITASCSGYTSATQTLYVKDKITARSLSITSPSSAATIYVGSTQSYTATGYTCINNGTAKYSQGAQTCTWTSSDTNVATMSGATATGKAGKGDGTESTVSTTIKASNSTYGDATQTLYVKDKVSERAYSVDITTSNFTLQYGGTTTQQLAWKTYNIKTVNNKDFGSAYEVTGKTVTFSSNKTGNATVNSSGKVTWVAGAANGTENGVSVTITATYSGKTDTVTCTTKDKTAKGGVKSRRLAVAASASTIYVGSTTTCTGTGYTTYKLNINGTDSSTYTWGEQNDGAQTCSWSSSTSNATVSSSGVVTGVKGKGDGTETTVTVTVTAKNSTYNSSGVSVTVNVKDKITSKFISITSPSSAATIYVGGTQSYTAKKYHRINNGTTNYDMGSSSISWSSSSTSVATMSGATATGKAGKGDGTESTVSTTITASCSGYTSATQTLYVKDKITSKFISITSPSSAATIYVGGTQTYTAKKYHRINNGTTNYDMGSSSISWSSSVTNVATMSGATATGKAGKGDGTESTVSTTITASCSGYTSATQTLYVKDKVSSRKHSVEITTTGGQLIVPDTRQFTCNTYDIKTVNGIDFGTKYAGGTPTWSSNKPSNATVDSNGLVTAISGPKDGTANTVNVGITATYGSYTDTEYIHIKDNVTLGALKSTSIAVTPTSGTIIYVGSKATLTATRTRIYYKDINGVQSNYTHTATDNVTSSCTWTSSNDSNATVSSGVVTGKNGKGDGTETTVAVTITASLSGVSGAATVNVRDKVSTRKHSVEISTSNFILIVPKTKTISYKTYDIATVNGTDFGSKYEVNGTPTWSSNKPSNATVSGGVVTAKLGKNNGTTTAEAVTITATYGNSDTVTANISDVIGIGSLISRTITVIPSNSTIDAGSTVSLTATSTISCYKTINGVESNYTTTSSSDVTTGCTWTSSDTSKATVSDGVVTGISAGDVTITATHSTGSSGTATVTVSRPTLESLSFSSTNFEIKTQTSMNLDIIATYSDGTSKIVNDEAQVTLSVRNNPQAVYTASYSNGVLSAGAAPISMQITATYTDGVTKTVTTYFASTAEEMVKINWSPAISGTITIAANKSATYTISSIEFDSGRIYTPSSVLGFLSFTTSDSSKATASLSSAKQLTIKAGKYNGDVTITIKPPTSMYKGECHIYVKVVGGTNPPTAKAVMGISTSQSAGAITLDTYGLSDWPTGRQLYMLWQNTSGTYTNISSGATWKSSNTSVATVSSSGYVTCRGAGTATITATRTYNGATRTATITVYGTYIRYLEDKLSIQCNAPGMTASGGVVNSNWKSTASINDKYLRNKFSGCTVYIKVYDKNYNDITGPAEQWPFTISSSSLSFNITSGQYALLGGTYNNPPKYAKIISISNPPSLYTQYLNSNYIPVTCSFT